MYCNPVAFDLPSGWYNPAHLQSGSLYNFPFYPEISAGFLDVNSILSKQTYHKVSGLDFILYDMAAKMRLVGCIVMACHTACSLLHTAFFSSGTPSRQSLCCAHAVDWAPSLGGSAVVCILHHLQCASTFIANTTAVSGYCWRRTWDKYCNQICPFKIFCRWSEITVNDWVFCA